MPRHYLLFASLAYAYPILRPLEEEIRRRGDVAAWFLEPECEDLLRDDDLRLKTFREVRDFAPVAVFAPGNWVYDFFPGIKVELFHGYPIAKRKAKHDDHFTIRNWFDIYCTQGPTSTVPFKKLEEKLGFFKVYETGRMLFSGSRPRKKSTALPPQYFTLRPLRGESPPHGKCRK